jgi:two-component system, cell cycle sensor histidine kinase and response regulator CckA
MDAENISTSVILLAEDEPLVRNLLRTVLTEDGYSVLDAHNGERALELSRGYTGAIQILITDIRMPGMDGLELTSHIIKERPGIKVLLMSGKVPGEPLVLGDARFLRKPFMPQTLRELLKSMLG